MKIFVKRLRNSKFFNATWETRYRDWSFVKHLIKNFYWKLIM